MCLLVWTSGDITVVFIGNVSITVNCVSIFSLRLMYVKPKCERYWCDEMNKPFQVPDRGFTVTVTGKKVYADYEIRDLTIRYVRVHAGAI